MAGEHRCLAHFRDWLARGMTGCRFANSIAAFARIAFVVQLDELAETDIAKLNAAIDDAGQEGNFAVILFPRIRTSHEIVRLLTTLGRSDRWQASRVPWRKYPRDGAGLVGLHFTSLGNDLSSVMGFAPLGCMPVTRRAPYVALALWSGEKQNTYKPTPAKQLGFVDGPVTDKDGAPVDLEAHKALWDLTMTQVKDLLRDPPEDDFRLKDVAFCLPESHVAELLGADGEGTGDS